MGARDTGIVMRRGHRIKLAELADSVEARLTVPQLAAIFGATANQMRVLLWQHGARASYLGQPVGVPPAPQVGRLRSPSDPWIPPVALHPCPACGEPFTGLRLWRHHIRCARGAE